MSLWAVVATKCNVGEAVCFASAAVLVLEQRQLMTCWDGLVNAFFKDRSAAWD